MITRKQLIQAQNKTARFLTKVGIVINKEEKNRIEVVDHGFGYHQPIRAQILVYINTKRYCAKEIILFPRQIVPEHRHPRLKNKKKRSIGAGKQETFRCRWGTVYLYVSGRKTKNPRAELPENKKRYFTVWKEIVLKSGMQYTLLPDTLHWFQSGFEGAVVSEFSSPSYDEYDIFTDPSIRRITRIVD